MKQKILFLCLLSSSLVIAKVLPPLRVTADEMTYNDKTKISVAQGKAVATFINSDGKQILQADSMTAHHNDDDVNGVDALFAKSTTNAPVLFHSPALTATATMCRYDGKTHNIFCSGCVKVTDLKKKDTITGDTAIINIQTKMYSVNSIGDNLSEAILHTGPTAHNP